MAHKSSRLWVSAIVAICVAPSAAVGAERTFASFVNESARQIPVVYEVDVVVVGGSVGGVAAAIEAAENGARVFLAAPRPYLGEDVCATQRFWLEPDERPQAKLAKQLFGGTQQTGEAAVPTPMHIKRTLDAALLEAKVDFLYSCYATDVLRDAAGEICGIAMVNRGGRQVVLAKTIIDATERATLARLAGAQFEPYPSGVQTFQRIVVGGEPRSAPGDSVRTLPFTRTVSSTGRKAAVFQHILRIPMADGSWKSWAAAEQTARDRTFHKGQLDASETLFQIPPDPMKGVAELSGAWPGAKEVSLDVFRPAGIDRLYVLGGCAAVSRKAAEALVRPLALIDAGARIGAAAAAEAKSLPPIKDAHIPGESPAPNEGNTRELLTGVRPSQRNLPAAPAEARLLPVLGAYDVVVIGGGTGGAAAGIGASRQGARTLLVEYLSELGGMGTLGVIASYYSGHRDGFTAEVTRGVQEMGMGSESSWSTIGKAEWWRRTNLEAGAEIWCGAMGVGAYVADGRVQGVIVATPAGRGVVLAGMVVDATGSADIAIAAGASYDFVNDAEPAIQGAGMHTLTLGLRGPNTDFTFADDTDVVDVWQMMVSARAQSPSAYDLGQLLQTRERRRIVGEACLSPMDLVLERTWPDTIALAKSHFDTHGFTVHPMFLARQPDIDVGNGQMLIPFRALLPQGLEGILVTSLGVSAHRDVLPIIRMQANLQNLGYAAGCAAALIARSEGRELDMTALQQHLVEKGCIPRDVLGAKDSLPLSPEEVRSAVVNVVRGSGIGHVIDTDWRGREHMVDAKYNSRDVAIIFSHSATAIPLLEEAYAAASSAQDRLLYAHLLGILGSPAGVEALLDRVQAAAGFDAGWDFKGMAQYGRNMSELDQFIISLASTRDPRAVDAVLDKLKSLDAGTEFSHHRACALALETLGNPRAAKPLADLLARPGMTGYSATTLDEIRSRFEQRSESLRELMLARALYRCGDHGGLGRKILEAYSHDLRGPYARHAREVLDRGDKDGSSK